MRKNEKPNPEYSTHIESFKKWTLPIAADSVASMDSTVIIDFAANIDSTTSNELDLNLLNLSMNNMNITNELSSRMQSHHNAFVSGRALKSNKNYKREPLKRIPKNLVQRAELRELNENNIPKSSTIQN
ncbi:8377_t:CDS:2 [Funneliformis geosporum]|nr:8377_t:CDS:2 [Funneliformis geosporum]